jgi:methionyl-tRNA synthetase
LFWPALLASADFKTPDKVHVHGHVMVNGEKMSKSKGTFISARVYLNHLDPQFLRYYYATKINGSVDDLDLNFDDFASRVNSDLVGKIVNLASRGAQMLTKKLDGTLSKCDADGLKLLSHIDSLADTVAQFYESRDFAKATTLIREMAESTNKYFDEKAPWKSLEPNPNETKAVLTTTLNAFRKIAIFLKPVLPGMSDQVCSLLNENPYVWNDYKKLIENHKVNEYVHLAQRVDPEKIKSMIEEQKTVYEKLTPKKKVTASTETTSEIEFEDFAKIDLRVAEIIEAEEIKEADKLLKLKVLIQDGQTKQIIAGIKSAYSADKLLGRKVLICANLKPRKMKFGVSEGMVLAAGDGGPDLFVLSPDSGAKTGAKVK